MRVLHAFPQWNSNRDGSESLPRGVHHDRSHKFEHHIQWQQHPKIPKVRESNNHSERTTFKCWSQWGLSATIKMCAAIIGAVGAAGLGSAIGAAGSLGAAAIQAKNNLKLQANEQAYNSSLLSRRDDALKSAGLSSAIGYLGGGAGGGGGLNMFRSQIQPNMISLASGSYVSPSFLGDPNSTFVHKQSKSRNTQVVLGNRLGGKGTTSRLVPTANQSGNRINLGGSWSSSDA